MREVTSQGAREMSERQGNPTVSHEDAKCIVKHLCRDMDVPEVKCFAEPNHPTLFGEYVPGSCIILYGEVRLSTVLHELAHHVHESRRPGVVQHHNLTFHRICFEVRDVFRSLYNYDVLRVAGSCTSTVAYEKALSEWFERNAPRR